MTRTPSRPVYLEVSGTRQTGFYATIYSSPSKQPHEVLGSLSLKNDSPRVVAAAKTTARQMFQ